MPVILSCNKAMSRQDDGDAAGLLADRLPEFKRTIDQLADPNHVETDLRARSRLGPVADRIAEVEELVDQWLSDLDPRRNDVPRAVRQLVLAEGLRRERDHA